MGMRTESQIISFIDIWVNTQLGTQEKAGLETVAMILLKLQDPNLLPIVYTAEPYRMCAGLQPTYHVDWEHRVASPTLYLQHRQGSDVARVGTPSGEGSRLLCNVAQCRPLM